MPLRKSRFVHLVPLSDHRVLVLHAVNQLRWTVDRELAQLIDLFAKPQPLFEARLTPAVRAALVDRGVLTEEPEDEELASIQADLSAFHGRDPEAALDQLRRQRRLGGEDYWSVTRAVSAAELDRGGRTFDLILFGDCDVQMEQDFLREAGAAAGLDLRIVATFPDDLGLAAERPHDALLIGGLRSRHAIMDPVPADGSPANPYIAEAVSIIERLRDITPKPILIDNLPEPTVQPLGLAERGLLGHRNRFRLANLALAQALEPFPDVHVVDVAAAIAGEGAHRLVDDGQVGYTHFGSPGWLLQRIGAERAAVHNQFPDMTALKEDMGGDPYVRERVLARTHVSALISACRIDELKCVILDLDGTLWPGVLAETGSPFAWSADVSSPFSFIGHYFGLHEALLGLKQRGVLLAAVSKNDEATVRALWRYPDHYPKARLLTFDDLVTWRINWDDKAGNIAGIAAELGFDPRAFLFIDDHPHERERVHQALPTVTVWGEDLLGLRRRLLSEPRLQPPVVTQSSASRTEMTRQTLQRERKRDEFDDRADFIASLDLKIVCRKLSEGEDPWTFDRVAELLRRTTQFTTTGLAPTATQIASAAAAGSEGVYVVDVSDRFGDHGLVGVGIVDGQGRVLTFALSCRVLGLGVERALLDLIIADHRGRVGELTGRIIETARNLPVRNLYRNAGFIGETNGVWRLDL